MARVKRFAWWTGTLLAACLCCAWATGWGQDSPAGNKESQASSTASVDSLLQNLKDPDLRVRMNAATELGNHPDAKAIPGLIDALGDEDQQVAWSAAMALRAVGEPAVAALTAQMDNPDRVRRRLAAQALAGIPGLDAMRGLDKALDDPDKAVRNSAIGAMGDAKYQDRRDLQIRVTRLVGVVTDDPDDFVAWTAADSLAKINDPVVLQMLSGALSPGSRGARWRVAMALGRTHNPNAVRNLLPALRDVDTQVRREAAGALAELASHNGMADSTTEKLFPVKPLVVKALIAALDDPDAEVRAYAAGALGAVHDDRAVEPLLAATNDPDHNVRASAAVAVAAFHDDRALPPLIAVLGAGDGRDRESAARTLGEFGDARAVEPLILSLKNFNNPMLQAAAAQALGQLHDARAVDPLAGLLAAPVAYVRRAGLKALGEIGDASVVPALVQAFERDVKLIEKSASSPQPLRIRTGGPAIEAARKQLGVAMEKPPPDPKADDLLQLCLQEAKTLAKIGDPRAIPVLAEALKSPSFKLRVGAVEALGNIPDPRAAQPLIATLASTDPATWLAAATALSQRKDPRALVPLIQRLQDADPVVRSEVETALDKYRSPRAIEPLIEAVRGDNDQGSSQPDWGVTRALVDIGPAAVEPLIRALKDPNRHVRGVAMSSLGELRDPRAFQPMLAAERDPNNEAVRSWFRLVTGDTLDPHDMKALATALQSGDMIAAINTLSWMGKQGVPLLIEALHSKNPEVRKRTAWVLSKSTDRRAAKALLAALQEQNNAVLAGAYIFYVQRGDAGTEDGLIAAYREFGDRSMQDTFMTCGDAKLAEAAKTWPPTRPDFGGGSIGAIWGQKELNRAKTHSVGFPTYWAGY